MKALTLVLCILALLGSAASGYFWWSIGETKTKLQADLAAEQGRAESLQNNLTQTNSTLEQTNARLAEIDADRADARSKLTAAEAKNVQASREVENLKKTLATKEENERQLNTDLDNLRRELVQTRLAAQVGSPEEVERYKQTVATLEARIAELQNSPGAGGTGALGGATSAVAPAKPAVSERTAAARVARVGTRNSFVVLELGVADGITVGNEFSITRGGETIAQAVISEVTDTFAIAQIAPSSIKSALRAGDIATYQN
jgi:hypothetical protein